jgi:hypothetical protein
MKTSLYDSQGLLNKIKNSIEKNDGDITEALQEFAKEFPDLIERKSFLVFNFGEIKENEKDKEIASVIAEGAKLTKLKIEIFRYAAEVAGNDEKKLQNAAKFVGDLFNSESYKGIYDKYFDPEKGFAVKAHNTFKHSVSGKLQGLCDKMIASPEVYSEQLTSKNVDDFKKSVDTINSAVIALKSYMPENNPQINSKTLVDKVRTKDNILISVFASNPKAIGIFGGLLSEKDGVGTTPLEVKPMRSDLISEAKKGVFKEAANIMSGFKEQAGNIGFAGGAIAGVIGIGFANAALVAAITYAVIQLIDFAVSKLNDKSYQARAADAGQENSEIAKQLVNSFNTNASEVKGNGRCGQFLSNSGVEEALNSVVGIKVSLGHSKNNFVTKVLEETQRTGRKLGINI